MEPLELTINLQRLSLQALAQSIWSSKPVVQCIKGLFIKMNELGGFLDWEHLIKEILKNLQRLSLPSSLYTELLEVVKVTGLCIYDWYFYLRNMEVFTSFTEDAFKTYMEEIYWTEIGTIDEVKILKQFWLWNPNVDLSKIFQLACLFCCTDVIDELWEKLPVDFRNANYSDKFWNRKFCIVLYWIYYKRSRLNEFIMKMRENRFYNSTKTLEENLMKSAVINGQPLAVKYFWNKFDDEKKRNNVARWFKAGFKDKLRVDEERQYKKDRFLEIYILLFNNMTIDMKRDVFVVNPVHGGFTDYEFNNFLGVLSWAYPWQELFIKAFIQLQGFLHLYAVLDFAWDLRRALNFNIYFGIGIKENAVQRQISMFWNLLFPEFKERVAYYIWDDLFRFHDVKNIKLIFNDSKLIQKRDDLCRIGYETLLLNSSTKEIIAEIAMEIFVFEDWNHNVKDRVRKVYDIILNKYDVDEAKEYLNSQCATDDERKEILEKINHDFLSYFLFRENSVKSLKNYCDWVFPSENKLDNFKKRLTNKQFTFDLIFKIWRAPSETKEGWSRDLCNEFLEWILYSDGQEISKNVIFNFKKNIILGEFKNRYTQEFIWPFHSTSDDFDRSFEFLSWCGCSEVEEINFFKIRFVKSFAGIYCREDMKDYNFQGAKTYIDTFFDTEEEKSGFKLKFITSDDGLGSLKAFIGHAKSSEINPERKKTDLVQQFKAVIDFWIQNLETCVKVEKHLVKEINDKFGKRDKDLLLKFQEEEKAIFPWDDGWKDIEEYVIWNEENLKLFLSLVQETRGEMEDKVSSDE